MSAIALVLTPVISAAIGGGTSYLFQNSQKEVAQGILKINPDRATYVWEFWTKGPHSHGGGRSGGQFSEAGLSEVVKRIDEYPQWPHLKAEFNALKTALNWTNGGTATQTSGKFAQNLPINWKTVKISAKICAVIGAVSAFGWWIGDQIKPSKNPR